MAVVVTEQHMAVGSWKAEVDWTPEVHEALYDRFRKRARLLHALIYDADDNLVCPPMVLRSVGGGKEGLTIGGVGPLWHPGIPGVGPAIRYREYVSGFDKLSNGSFDLLDEDGTATYWRRVSQESRWTFSAGAARNPGGLDKDDIIEPDIDRFPTRPGHAYRLRIVDLIGTGEFRARTIYDGRFDPPNIMENADFDEGPGNGWGTATNLEIVPAVFFGGYYALRIVPIPKPQLADNLFATEWTLGATMSVASDVLFIEDTPKPQYLARASTDFSVSPFVTWDNADASKSFSGTGYYWQIGPIGQHQVVTNGGFESGLTGWVQVAGAWSTSTAQYVEGANSATTGGIAGGAIKSLQADSDTSTPLVVDPFPLGLEEEWRFDGSIRSGDKGTSDEADGECHLYVYIVDQAYPLFDSTLDVVSARGDDLDAATWKYGQQTYSGQPDKVAFVPMMTIFGHTAGSWYADNIKATRIRGNNTGIYSDDFPAIPKQRYSFRAFAISDPRIGGSVTMRLIFKGTGLPDIEERGSAQSHTFGKWITLSVEATCPDGYDTMVAAIDGDDITGGSFYVAGSELIWLEKSDNNTDRATHTPLTVIESQHYELAATVIPLGPVASGTVTIGVVLSGPAVSDETVSVEQSFRDDEGLPSAVSVSVTPREGYTTAAPFVLARDLSGGNGAPIVGVANLTLTKMDNNSDSIAHDTIDVTPERTYLWSEKVASDAALRKGTVQLVAKCIRSGFPDQTFPSNAMTPADDGSFQTLELNFTPPSGYSTVECSIVATDVEGSNIFVDKGEMRDTDASTVVFDSTVTNPVGATLDVDSTAPTGAEGVRVQLIAPSGTSGWIVGAASLARTGVTPATGDSIVAELLTHPRTHAPVLAPGAITCPEVIPADWEIVNLNDREALDHYCTVVSDPPREYRFQLVTPPTIDVGTAEDVCTDHTDMVLLVEDIDVQDMGGVDSDATERATEIVLLGNERQTSGGQRSLIRATATVPGGTEYDYNGNPVERSRFVSDGTVDHHNYAMALASDLARREAEPPLSVTVKLSGRNTRPGLRVGDWLYAYHPASGIEDQRDDNAVVIDGQTVYPRQVRALELQRTLGPSHRIVMRRHDGTTFDLPGVRWSAEDATTVTIGDRLPSWQADPQGKAAGLKYLDDRKSRPR